MSDKKERVLMMCRLLASYYAEKHYAVCREVGLPNIRARLSNGGFLTKRRADFIAINKAEEVVIVETKSCLSDFTSDKKWQDYLPHCNKFYFCAEEKVAEKILERLEADPSASGVGVFSVVEDERRFMPQLKVSRPAYKHDRATPILPLLWQMAAHSWVRYDGEFRTKNIFFGSEGDER